MRKIVLAAAVAASALALSACTDTGNDVVVATTEAAVDMMATDPAAEASMMATEGAMMATEAAMDASMSATDAAESAASAASEAAAAASDAM